MARSNNFNRDLLRGLHDFSADTFKLALSNTAITAATASYTAITEIAAGGGYVAGGFTVTATPTDLANGSAESVAFSNPSVTATAPGIAAYRYWMVYNDTSAGKRAVAFGDLGSSAGVSTGDTRNFDTNEPFVTLS